MPRGLGNTAAKNPYRGGSTPKKTNCGKGVCPANRRLISVLHYVKNRDDYLFRAKAQPKDKTREYKKRWKELNPDAVAKNTAERKSFVRQRTPKWLTKEHHDQILGFYTEARRVSAETGINHEVDHIAPLRSEVVCGLHVPWNMRVIPDSENQLKNNKFIEDLCLPAFLPR